MIGWLRAVLVPLVVATFASGTEPTSVVSGPVIVVRKVANDASVIENEAPTDDVAMSLAVASISPFERRWFLMQMNATTARLEARLSPLAVDLGDDDVEPLDELAAAMAPRMPTFTAARAFAKDHVQAPGVEARIASSCEAARVAADETCVPLWGPKDPRREVERARFVAWAASHAAVFDFTNVHDAEACAETLRTQSLGGSSSIGLVVTADDLALRPVPERTELRESTIRLGRLMAANRLDDSQHLSSFAKEAPHGVAVPWLSLGARSLAVVPRLSRATAPEKVTREIETFCTPTKWTHRP